MTHVATMGCSSCATIAIGGFKAGQKEINDAYLKDPKSFVEPKEGLTLDGFYNNVLYPTSQPLGKTKEYPFEKLMQDLKTSSMSSKFVIATINQGQYMGNERYWHKQLVKWGFQLFKKANNSIGSVNYIYFRNPNEVEIKDGEAD